MREYYTLFSCDAWKSHSSMRMVGVFTLSGLKKVIRGKIKDGDFKFEQDRKDIDSMDGKQLDTALVYGYIQPVQINQEL